MSDLRFEPCGLNSNNLTRFILDYDYFNQSQEYIQNRKFKLFTIIQHLTINYFSNIINNVLFMIKFIKSLKTEKVKDTKSKNLWDSDMYQK